MDREEEENLRQWIAKTPLRRKRNKTRYRIAWRVVLVPPIAHRYLSVPTTAATSTARTSSWPAKIPAKTRRRRRRSARRARRTAALPAARPAFASAECAVAIHTQCTDCAHTYTHKRKDIRLFAWFKGQSIKVKLGRIESNDAYPRNEFLSS